MAYEPYGKKVPWDVENSMLVNPDDGSLTYPWVYVNSGTGSRAANEGDNRPFNGKRMTINSSTTAINDTSYFKHETAGKPWFDYIDNALGWTVDFRVQVVLEGSSMAFQVFIYDGTYYDQIQFTGTTISSRWGHFSTITLTGSDVLTNDTYTWIRIIGKGTDVRVYVNGKLRATGTMFTTTSTKLIYWGDIEALANHGGQTVWDFFRYTTRGAFSPIDEWQSEWLFDTDPTSQSLLQDFPKAQVGSPTYAIEADSNCLNGYRLRISTNPLTSGEYLLFGSTARGILGGTNHLQVNSVGYTVETRVKVVSSGSSFCQGIQLCDGVYTSVVRFRGTDIIVEAQFISESDQTYSIPNTAGAWNDYHTIRIYTKGTLLKVFVDNVLAITGTLDLAESASFVQFGDLNGSVNYGGVCYWDYFRIHAQDAIDPTRMAHRWDVQYEHEFNPYTNTRHPWNVGNQPNGTPTVTIQSDADCINGKRMRIDIDSGEYYFLLGATNYVGSNRNDPFNNLVDNVKGFTYELRFKIISVVSGYPLSFDIYAQDYFDQLWISDTRIRTKFTGFDVTGLVLTDKYHILTINYKGNIGRVFLDGILISQFTRVNTNDTDIERFWWGVAGDGVGVIDYDYARYNTEGAFDPLGCKEDISVTENVSLAKSVLYIDVFEASGLLVTEHVDIIDLVVELGVVDDFVGITENTELSLDVLNISFFDVSSITESVVLFDQYDLPLIYEVIKRMELVSI